MASHTGVLPASNEVVLEIQLNKLINDFLFPGAEDYGKALRVHTDVVEAQDGCKLREDPSCQGDSNSGLGVETSCASESTGSPFHLSWGTANSGGESGASTLSHKMQDAKGLSCHHDSDKAPITADVRLDISNLGYAEIIQQTSKLNVFHLSETHSVTGSVFCFTMEREEHGEKKDDGNMCAGKPRKGERRSTKLSRVSSIPWQSKAYGGSDTEIRQSCRKPPRPPRVTSEKGTGGLLSTRPTSTETILVLHGPSPRARSERRKKPAAVSSSNASMWALIFTLCFVLAILGEGFWSQG